VAAPASSVKRLFVNGVVITIPLIATLLVALVVLDFILGVLSPVITGITYVWPDGPSVPVIEFATLASVIGVFLLVGLVAEYTPGTYLSKRVHATMETIPGVSTVYESVRRASTLLVEDDSEKVHEVDLMVDETFRSIATLGAAADSLGEAEPGD